MPPRTSLSTGYLAGTAAMALLVVACFLAQAAGTPLAAAGIDVALAASILGGWGFAWRALANLLRGRVTGSLAITLAAGAAIAVGEYLTAAEVIAIMHIGECLERYAVGRTRRDIEGLLDRRPSRARVRRGGEVVEVPAGAVRPGEIVLVRPGEIVPVDGRVAAGSSEVDQSSLTGESLPARKEPGAEVYAGSVNGLGALEIEALAAGEATLLERAARLVSESLSQRAPVERALDRFAVVFVPAVLAAAGGTYLATGEILRAVAVLVVACPCSLVLATPTAVVAAVGRLASSGILVKGGPALEAAARVRTFAFDKTGTLTAGRPAVRAVHPADGVAEERVLARAAAAESASEHLLARAIVEAARARGIAPAPAPSTRAVPGRGVEAEVEGEVVRVGNRAFLASRGIPIPPELASAVEACEAAGSTGILVAAGERALGLIAFGERLRPEAAEAVRALRRMGVRRIALLTGDARGAAERVGSGLGMGDVRAELLPHEKVEAIRALREGGARVAFAGDGLNDAPSLAAADLGIAMGGDARAELSVEAADAVLLEEDLRRIPELLRWSRRAVRTIWQSIIAFAVIYNAVGVALAATGVIRPFAGAIFHQIGSLLVVLNALRIRFTGRWHETAPGRAAAALGRWGAAFGGALEPRVALSWIARRRRAVVKTLAGLAAIAWLASGVAVVPPGWAGIVTRFGRRLPGSLGPGLVVRLPRPFERVRVVPRDRVRRVEIGFRSRPGAGKAGLEIYEWGVAHAGIQPMPEEGRSLTGDQNFIETKLGVQYAVVDPKAFLFHLGDGKAADELVRAAAEATLRRALAGRTFHVALAEGRREVEQEIVRLLGESPAVRGAGLGGFRVALRDAHPPVEVVPSFRDVAAALNDKDRLQNRAEAYRIAETHRAQGEAKAERVAAAAYRETEVARARGGADRFAAVEEGYRKAAAVTGLRMFLETVEEGLAAVRKVILDPKGEGRRAVWFRGAEVLPLEIPAAAAGGGGRP